MGVVLKFMILLAILGLAGGLIVMAVTSARKRAHRERLDALSFDELAAQVRELWSRGERMEDVIRLRASSSSLFGSEAEALAEALMHSVASSAERFDERYALLVTHYTWLLDLFARYMEARWSWSDMPVQSTLKSQQVVYKEPSSSVEYYPRPNEGVFGLELNATVEWLNRYAKQHAAEFGENQRMPRVPSWNADLFSLHTTYKALGVGSVAFHEIQCSPAAIRQEIARLRGSSDARTRVAGDSMA